MSIQKVLSPALSSGIRSYDPMLQMMKKYLPKEHLYNFTTDKVYHHMLVTDKIPIPPMHSICIPQYLKLKQKQNDLMIDDGYRIYEKWPVQRFIYRSLWTVTIGNFIWAMIGYLEYIYQGM